VNESNNKRDKVPNNAEQAWPSPTRAWYAVLVFMIALMFAFIDRQVITLLVGPIKKDLGISDTEMSLLLGFAFAFFYGIVGMPIARLADVKSRRAIVGFGIATWSLMTAACGLAQNYWQLFVARMGVGIGEACNGPATFSMLSDYFPKDKLPRATSVLGIGLFLGSGLALIVGGTVVQLVSNSPTIAVPLIGDMRPWQLTFIVVGLPGLLVAALLRTVQEPQRRGLIVGQDATKAEQRPESIPVKEIVRYFFNDRKTYLPMYIGIGLRSMILFGTSVWLPTFFIRTYGWSIGQVGLSIGTVLLTISPVGLIAGGYLAEWFAKKGYNDANMRVNLISTIFVLPISVLYPLMPSAYVALGLYAVNSFIASMSSGPVNAALQTITPNQMRAQLTSVFIFIFNLVGLGIGPIVVASLTDYVFAAEEMLRYSIATNAGVLGLIASLLFWYGLKPYGESVKRAKARN
jgi:MFS family permease